METASLELYRMFEMVKTHVRLGQNKGQKVEDASQATDVVHSTFTLACCPLCSLILPSKVHLLKPNTRI